MRRSELENIRQLLVRGIAAAKAGETSGARYYLETALNRRPDPAQEAEAAYWLSQVETDPAKQRAHLEHALALMPSDPRARRAMAILQGHLAPDEIVTGNTLPVIDPTDPSTPEPQRFECPSCGSRLVFAPDGQSLLCENCDYRATIETSGALQPPVSETDFIVGMSTLQGHLTPHQQQVFSCSACGAEFLLEPQRLSFTCPHCESNYAVIQTHSREVVAPAGLLPPSISAQVAEENIKKWKRSHKLESAGALEQLHGVYFPIWSFDLSGNLTWRTEIYRNREWQPLTGSTLVDFNDLLVPASRTLPAGLEPELQSLDTATAVLPDTSYFAGWLNQTYSISMSDAAVAARAETLERTRRRLDPNIPGQHRELYLNSLGLILERFKLLLVPIWVSHYSQAGTRYAVHVLACNGVVFGELP